MIDNVITVYKDYWQQERDGRWYIHIPFECTSDQDVILELADTHEYVKIYGETFDNLNNGESLNNEVVITCNIKPECDIHVILKTLEEAGGAIARDASGAMEYIPPKEANDFMSMLMGLQSQGIVDSLGNKL